MKPGRAGNLRSYLKTPCWNERSRKTAYRMIIREIAVYCDTCRTQTRFALSLSGVCKLTVGYLWVPLIPSSAPRTVAVPIQAIWCKVNTMQDNCRERKHQHFLAFAIRPGQGLQQF